MPAPTPERLAWLGLLLDDMNGTGGDMWYPLRALIALQVPGTSEVIGGGVLHQQLCRLGWALADLRGAVVDGWSLDWKRDTRNRSVLYRAIRAPSPSLSSQRSPTPDARAELALLRAELIAWQKEGERLRDRVVAWGGRFDLEV